MGRLTTLSISRRNGLPLVLVLESAGLVNLKLTSCNLSLAGLKLDKSCVAPYRLARLVLDEVSNVPISILFGPQSCHDLEILDIQRLEAAIEEPLVICQQSQDGVYTRLANVTMDAQGGCKNFIETATFGPGVEVMFPAVSVLRVKPVLSPSEQHNEDYNGLFPQLSFAKIEHLYIEGQ